MSTEEPTVDLPPNGMYRVHHVQFGVAYNGWLLITAVKPEGRTARIEFAFLPLDPKASGLPAITPVFDSVDVQLDYWSQILDVELAHRITGLHDRIEAWGRDRGIPDQPRPRYPEVSQKELRDLGLRTLVMPDDDILRRVWREGLDRLGNWTRCPALADDLHGGGWKGRVTVDRS